MEMSPLTPTWGWVPQATCPLPLLEPAGGEDGVFWVWALVLFRIRLFLGRGRGVCADYSRLVRLVPAALQCCINARKGE